MWERRLVLIFTVSYRSGVVGVLCISWIMGLGHGMVRIEVWVWKGGGGITIIISVGMIVYMFTLSSIPPNYF